MPLTTNLLLKIVSDGTGKYHRSKIEVKLRLNRIHLIKNWQIAT